MSTVLELQIGSLINGLAECLCDEVAAAVKAGTVSAVCMCTVVAGEAVAYDYCEKGGMAWSRLVAIVPIESEVRGGYGCATEYEVTAQVGILRCAPTLGPRGELPKPEAHLASALMQNFDMGIMHKVLTCCEVPSRFDGPKMGDFLPIGPDGGCLGGTWQATWRFS
jgi:hypothetical protein